MAETITSVNNDIIKLAASLEQKKFRDETGLFLLEGKKPLEEAIKAGVEIEKLFLSKEESYAAKESYIVTESVMKKISTTQTPPSVAAIAKKQDYTLEQLNGKTIVLLEDIKDPGNLGTIIRTAAALGAHLIVLTGDCVDLYNPKVIRSATGNIFKVPIVYSNDWEQMRHQFRNHKFIGTILDPDKHPIELNKANFNMPTVIMFGSEANGLSPKAMEYVQEYIKIPLQNEVESLNLAISAGIILYKALVH
ncbi:MAG: RNA methyltransferase [Candidatus Gastranaerophilales bacterium]|nr:RNA methyltransferase [Candidatus Gastranaerophilales bacterium]